MKTPACISPQPARRISRLIRGKKIGIAALLLLLTGGLAWAAPDPTKVEGALTCGECHKSEIEAWKLTKHFDTFNRMHREPKAQEIADKLGLRRIKVEAVCLNCHYTSKVVDDKPEVIAGISCESCHGAAKGWVKVHNDFGGSATKKENETPAHRTERIAKSTAAGMIRPEKIYDVAANCFGCHTVPQEDVVNAGHPAGSDFDLVAWSQGEIRHNFVADLKKNVEPNAAHKRLLFAVGRILDVEYSLRSAAKATKDGVFATAMSQRVANAIKRLKDVDQAVGSPELKEIIAAGSAAEPKVGNGTALAAAADKVAAAGRKFAEANDGSKLAAVDALLPANDKYKGKVFQP